jgi:hypothetical protein
MRITNNTTTTVPTYFPMAAQLIIAARATFSIPSENWTYPIQHLGDPQDPDYLEVWSDGMDWQDTFWLVERLAYSEPRALPLLIRHDDKVRWNQCDRANLFHALMDHRRSAGRDSGRFNDTAWPYLKFMGDPDGNGMVEAEYSHASQAAVAFLVLAAAVPDLVRSRRVG